MAILPIAAILLGLFGNIFSKPCYNDGLSYPYNGRKIFNYIVCENVTMKMLSPLQVANGNYAARYILFRNSHVKEISSNAFALFKDTTKIYLNSSGVEKIEPDDAFRGGIQLQELYLQDNKIEKLMKGALYSLPNLVLLNLSNNYLKKLENEAFYGLINLRTLDLSHNQLHEIYKNSFANMLSLQTLLLNGNFLKVIHRQAFENITVLRFLDISHNNLEAIDFSSLPYYMQVFNMSNNRVSYVKDWSWLRNIPTVDFSYNNITKVSYIGKGVAVLNLRKNKLESISRIMLRGGEDLVNLDLSHNFVQDIEKDAFQYLPKLEKLNLGHNRLVQLPIGCFRNLTSLWELKLSYNSISRILYGTFAGLDNITLLYLDNNNLTVIHESSFYVLRKLQVLYLTNNEISSLNVRKLLSHLNIKMIGLNGNKWPCNTLFDLIDILTNEEVGFYNGSDYNIENVNGISCTSKESMHDIAHKTDKEKIGFLMKPTVNEELKNLNTLKYFNKAFTDSTFYKFFKGFKKTNFFKYFNQSFTDSSFFRYFDRDFKNSSFYKFSNGLNHNINKDQSSH